MNRDNFSKKALANYIPGITIRVIHIVHSAL